MINWLLIPYRTIFYSKFWNSNLFFHPFLTANMCLCVKHSKCVFASFVLIKFNLTKFMSVSGNFFLFWLTRNLARNSIGILFVKIVSCASAYLLFSMFFSLRITKTFANVNWCEHTSQQITWCFSVLTCSKFSLFRNDDHLKFIWSSKFYSIAIERRSILQSVKMWYFISFYKKESICVLLWVFSGNDSTNYLLFVVVAAFSRISTMFVWPKYRNGNELTWIGTIISIVQIFYLFAGPPLLPFDLNCSKAVHRLHFQGATEQLSRDLREATVWIDHTSLRKDLCESNAITLTFMCGDM